MSGKHGWKCSRCTFEHQFPGTRCVMCQSLRTTKEQLIGFVQGIPIPESSKVNTSTVSAVPPPGKPAAAAAAAATTTGRKKTGSTSNTNTTAQQKLAPAPTAPQSNAVRQPPPPNFLHRQKPTNAAESVAAGNKTMPASVQNSATTDSSSNFAAYTIPNSDNPGNSSNANPYANNHDRSTEPHSNHLSNGRPMNQALPNNNNITNPNPNNYSAAAANPYRNSVNNNTNQAPRPPQHTKTNAATKATAANKRNRNARDRQPDQIPNGIRGHSKARPPLPYIPGPVPFDESTLSNWIFPIHEKFPKRNYQQEMAESAIFENTLVSLPTGLGKTMIAAVVMYNYYRWFPTGKVIFCAPTLPLVQQQVKAIYDIVGIPHSDIAVLTGKINATDREVLWNEKRVFFCTPQTVQNDLKNETSNIAFSRVVCLVLDEVHKASGDHAYVKVAELLEAAKAKFRLVGLSATPGTDIRATQDVIRVLRVSKIDCRFDDDPDIKPHTHDRHDELVTVHETTVVGTIKQKLLDVMRKSFQELQKNGFFCNAGSGATLAPYSVIRANDDYKRKVAEGTVRQGLYPHFAVVQKVLTWRQSVQSYGIGDLRSKLTQFINENSKRGAVAEMAQSEELKAVKDLVFNSTDCSQGNADAERLLAGNPKLLKLQEVLKEHFLRAKAVQDQNLEQRSAQEGELESDTEASTCAIVFSQFRESVAEIVSMLEASRPLIRPSRFVGQGKGSKSKDDENGGKAVLKGMNQAEQQNVIQAFRDGKFNVLVCTSIGEEGLDVGQCDLIVMFDMLQSPTRMIQRTGRTGRSRNGRVVLLLTKTEESKYKTSKAKEKTLLRSLKDPNKFHFHPNHSMFPTDRPLPALCEKMGLSNDAEFRLSQVVGNFCAGKRKRRKSSDGAGPGFKRHKNHEESTRWKLTEDEDRLRSEFLGSEIDKSTTKFTSEFPSTLRKRFLKAREMSYSAQTPIDLSRYRLGSTLSIARSIQEMYGDRYDPCKIAVPRSFKRESKVVQSLFPLKECMSTPCPLGTFLERKRVISAAPSAVVGASTAATTTLDTAVAVMYRSSDTVSLRSDENHRQQATRAEAQSVPQETRAHIAEQPQSTEPISCANLEQNNPQQSRAASQDENHAPVLTNNATKRPAPEIQRAKFIPSRNPYKKVATLRESNTAAGTRAANPYAATAARKGRSDVPPAATPSGQGRSVPPGENITNAAIRPAATLAYPTRSVPIQVQQTSNKSSSSAAGAGGGGGESTMSLAFTGIQGTTGKTSENSNCNPDLHERMSEEGKTINPENATAVQADVEFYLPTPPDSSSSEDEGESDDDCNSDNEGRKKEAAAVRAVNCANITHGLAASATDSRGPACAPREPSIEERISPAMPTVEQGAVPQKQPPEAPKAARVVIENLPSTKDPACDRTASNAMGTGTDVDAAHASQSSFRLPTQSDSSSSSSEEENDEDSAVGNEETDGKQVAAKAISTLKTASMENDTTLKAVSGMHGDPSEDEFEEDDDDEDMLLVSLRNSGCSGGSKQTMSPHDGFNSQESPENVFIHRNNLKKKQVNHFLTQVEMPASNSKTPQHKRPGSGGLVDTPLQLIDTPRNRAVAQSAAQDLADTPPEASLKVVNVDYDADDVACAVCLSKDFHDDDPIVFCDGFGSVSCNLPVHVSCYSIDDKDLGSDKPWRCDPCATKDVAGRQTGEYARCCVCQKSGGALKKVSARIWHHPYCVQWQNHSPVGDEICGICSQRGAVRCGREACKLAVHPHCAIDAIASSGAPGESWTLLRIDFSASGSSVEEKENCQSLMFCPKDRDEARTIFQSISAGMGNQSVSTIPPDCLRQAKPRRLKKLAEPNASHPSRQQSKDVIDIDEQAQGQAAATADTEEARQARKRARLESRRMARRFMDEEAGIGSDDDLEGDAAEERDLAALEADELSVNSFINDSSQLGYTQDDLGRVDPDASATPAASLNDRDDAVHRRLDNDRARRNQYATPLLNRKMARNSLTPSDAPSSEKGLGRMHFVRSVLEHHKNGGDADEIERAYHRLEQEEAEVIDLGDDDDNDVAFDYGFDG